MWFKNIHFYRFYQKFSLTEADLYDALSQHVSRDCSKLERSTYGWTAPLGMAHQHLVHTIEGKMMIAACKREKILPTSIVREETEKRLLDMEAQQAHPPSRRDRRNMIEEVTLKLLPQALTKSSITYAYIDVKQGWLVIDTPSRKNAEDFTVLLRNSLGALPVSLPKTKQSIRYTLTNWLLGIDLPAGLQLEEDCELQDPENAKAQIKCQHQDISSDLITAHVNDGMQAIKLALSWQDRMSFTIDEHFIIRKVKFLDLEQQEMDNQAESAEEQFSANFSIFSGDFAKLLPLLIKAFGGLESAKEAALVEKNRLSIEEEMLVE